MLDIGRVLDGKYEVIRVLGQGGMGTVYLCRNKRLQNFWAVKEVYEISGSDTDTSGEPEILKKLKHPGIPRIVDIFNENNCLYMVEDYIEGVTLEKMVDSEGKMESHEVCGIALKICDILGYLHRLDPPIIYRDLKPSNIMITPSGEVMLIDFGISRVYKKNKVEDTVYMGSKGFAAPEQYGGGQSNEQTDIFGLGATMYFMVSGRVPPPGGAFFNAEDNVPEELGNIISRAMHPGKESRYASVDELKNGLSSFLSSPNKTVVMSKDMVKTAVFHKPSTPGIRPVRNKKNKMRLIAGAAVVLMIIAAGEFLFLHGSKFLQAKKDGNSKPGQGVITETAEEKVSGTPTPSLTPTPSPVPKKAMYIEGIIYKDAPITLDGSYYNEKNKSKGKHRQADDRAKDLFYKVSPMAEAGRLDDNFTVSIIYLELNDGNAALYCTVVNRSGKNIGISFRDTVLTNDEGKAFRADSTGILNINDGTYKQDIKIGFKDFKLDTNRIILKTRIISEDQSIDDTMKLAINVK